MRRESEIAICQSYLNITDTRKNLIPLVSGRVQRKISVRASDRYKLVSYYLIYLLYILISCSETNKLWFVFHRTEKVEQNYKHKMQKWRDSKKRYSNYMAEVLEFHKIPQNSNASDES